ncbi:MAG: TetM/TetW/TetO/TetS family tetracycline resistance ribosomal protection protein, partial [Planctomycetales bacterium]|nr:TetM/TetW/TetO/TetS family tetracycline resistance ribosomal protection protein [Planctomycetales bacterium]
MMMLAMDQQPIPAAMIHQALRAGTLAMKIQPLLCGSALHGIGVQPVLDAVTRYLPSPLDRPPVEGDDLAAKKQDEPPKTLRKPDPSEPFAGLAFKVQPAKTGDLTWVRVYSGTLKANSRVLNPGKDKKENVAQLWQIHVTKRDRDGQIDTVSAGDIVGIIGLRHTVTGDTLCEAKEPLLLEPIQFPETVISMAIEPENATERDKLQEALALLLRQDPTLQVQTGESGQTLLRGMGELHLEVYQKRLLRDFKLKVRFHKPEVSYRETVGQRVEVVGECNRQIGGQTLFAKLKLRVEPLEEATAGVQVLTQCPPERLPGELLEATLDALRSCGESGGLISGYPLMRLRVTILDAEINETSNDVAFRIAANEAFNAGLQQGGPVLLEPVMRVNIATPEEYVGDFVGDLHQRRAVIQHTESQGAITQIEANAPLKELFGYSSAMRSLSQGRAQCSIEPLHYAPAPEAELKRFM